MQPHENDYFHPMGCLHFNSPRPCLHYSIKVLHIRYWSSISLSVNAGAAFDLLAFDHFCQKEGLAMKQMPVNIEDTTIKVTVIRLSTNWLVILQLIKLMIFPVSACRLQFFSLDIAASLDLLVSVLFQFYTGYIIV